METAATASSSLEACVVCASLVVVCCGCDDVDAAETSDCGFSALVLSVCGVEEVWLSDLLVVRRAFDFA